MNIKQVSVKGVIPFCWMDEIDTADLAVMSRMFLSPSSELKLKFGVISGMRPNADGSDGRTTFYHFRVEGQTSIRWSFIQDILGILKLGGAEFEKARAIDIEDTPSKWEDLIPTRPFMGKRICS